ncbi:MAG: DUF4112 domain-containing protein [Hoeflea sp.]|uniref:DUF4112 domain-containing protein n=1 Tax=Hoeflea sp. TaxID=1940281 RepID=UPI0032EC6F55
MSQSAQIPPRRRDEIDTELARLERLASLLDARFRLPGTSIRFGIDGIAGLIPGIGDTLTAAPSAWMIWRGHKLGVRRRMLVRMIANSGIDYLIGLVPLVGDIFDVGFKANLRNAAILRDELTARDYAGASADTLERYPA